MDETNQKLIEAPRRSKKTLYLILILVFLVALIVVMSFNKKEKNQEGENNINVTREDQAERLAETPSTATNPDFQEQERRLRESVSSNEDSEGLTYKEQLEILKNN